MKLYIIIITITIIIIIIITINIIIITIIIIIITLFRAQELCESRSGRPGLPSLISLRFLWM